MCKCSDRARQINFLYKQIENKLPFGSTVDLWDEGYRIGHAIDSNYRATGRFQLPAISGLTGVKSENRGYLDYLGSNMHAWAVPVSYHYLLANSGPALDKRLNLWGSTQSHEKYFEKLIGMILNHLKRSELPLLEGFVDVGCGDGSLLKALRRVMKQEFDRPFVYIGFDLDEESSGIAKENASEGILFLKGDVARPDELNECLISRGLPSLDRFFHMRAFVDHNCRPFFRQFQGDPMPDHFGYCYLHDGRLVSMEFVEESFGGHFVRWKPFVQRNGLGIIELHNVEEYDLTESPAIAYEIFHLLSEQYVMPYHRYAELWKHTGLRLMDRARIPEGISNTNVSISIYGS